MLLYISLLIENIIVIVNQNNNFCTKIKYYFNSTVKKGSCAPPFGVNYPLKIGVKCKYESKPIYVRARIYAKWA